MQLDLEDKGIKKTLEELYIEMLQRGIKDFKKEKPAN
jgi:hypothetical protein